MSRASRTGGGMDVLQRSSRARTARGVSPSTSASKLTSSSLSVPDTLFVV